MKYVDEFKKSRTKDIFVNKLLRKYHMQKSSAVRRFYELRIKLNITKEIITPTPILVNIEYSFLDNPEIIAEEPGIFKMLLVDDIKRFAKNNIINELKTQGFTMGEIKWLKKNTLI